MDQDLLQQTTETLRILHRVGNVLGAERDLQKIVQAVTDAGREISKAEFGAFFYNAVDEKGESYTLYTLSGAPREAFAKYPMPRNTEIFAPTFRGEGIVRSDDILQDPRYGKNAPYHGMPAGHLPVRSYLAVPVKSRTGATIGGLFYGHSQIGVFKPESEGALSALASQAAVAIDNANLYAALEKELEAHKAAEITRGRLASIVESSDDAIVAKNLNGIVQSWNGGAERLFGYTADEMVGRSIVTLLPEDRLHEETAIITRIRAGERVDHFETIRRRKDGTPIHISLSISPLRDSTGSIIGASKIARDITDRKRVETEQKALYELVAAVNQAHSLQDTYAAALGALRECQRADCAAIFIEKTDLTYEVTTEGCHQRSFEKFGQELSRTPLALFASEASVPDLLASNLSAELRAAFTQDGIKSFTLVPIQLNGRRLGFFAICYFRPHQFRTEEFRTAATIAGQVAFAIERQKASEALESLVNERTASLREAIAQLEEFSYTVSHDLRAPLRGMHAYSTALVEDFGAILPPEAQRYTRKISENATKLDRMINDVLTFSRLAREDINIEPVELEKLLHEIVSQYPQMQPPYASVEIGRVENVLGHEPSLTQAISNLLTNAIKFVPPDRPPLIKVWTERTGPTHETVRIWIRDNGIGIDPQYQHRLFNMFERIHGAQKFEGTGVGLAIVKKAMERSGGACGMESDGANGSAFWLELKAFAPKTL